MDSNPPQSKPEEVKADEKVEKKEGEEDPAEKELEAVVENQAYADLNEVDEDSVDVPEYLFRGKNSTWEDVLDDYPKVTEEDPQTKEKKEVFSNHTKTLINNLRNSGYQKPSYIQYRAIPFLAESNCGLRAQSQNGTGKTLAYIIPTLMSIDPKKSLDNSQKVVKPQAIIMTPNAILVKQIKRDLDVLSANLGENILVKHRMDNKKNKYDKGYIFLGTPKHLDTALISDGIISLEETKILVIDEADAVIKDFQKSLEKILGAIAKLKKQIKICFISATYTEEAKAFTEAVFTKQGYGESVMRIEILSQNLKLESVTQYKAKFDNANSKNQFIIDLITCVSTQTQYIIFVNGREYAQSVYEALDKANIDVTILTGDVRGKDRAKALEEFRLGTSKVLITTNLLARGYDERGIGIVINYDVPTLYGDKRDEPDIENYIHRVGRTGRFGDAGIAINLHYDRELVKLKKIEDAYKTEMEVLESVGKKASATIEKKIQEVEKLNKEKRSKLKEKDLTKKKAEDKATKPEDKK